MTTSLTRNARRVIVPFVVLAAFTGFPVELEADRLNISVELESFGCTGSVVI